MVLWKITIVLAVWWASGQANRRMNEGKRFQNEDSLIQNHSKNKLFFTWYFVQSRSQPETHTHTLPFWILYACLQITTLNIHTIVLMNSSECYWCLVIHPCISCVHFKLYIWIWCHASSADRWISDALKRCVHRSLFHTENVEYLSN